MKNCTKNNRNIFQMARFIFYMMLDNEMKQSYDGGH